MTTAGTGATRSRRRRSSSSSSSVAIYGLRFGTLPDPVLLAASVYWGGLNVILLSNFVTRSWYGLTSPRRALFRLDAEPS